MKKFDRGACLGIVYESILPFQQFLIDIKFRRDLEIFRVRDRSERDSAAARQRPPSEDGSWRSPVTWLKNEKINFYAKEQL
jgi:hypothetical protein